MSLLLSLMLALAPGLGEDDSRRAMADYARCAADEQPDMAARAVVEDWHVGDFTRNAPTMLEGGCLRAAGLVSRMRFRAENFRAGLAERLIARDPALAPTAGQLAALPPLKYHLPWPVRTTDDKGRPLKAKAIQAQTKAYQQKLGIVAGQQVAECVVKANPAAVRPLFATRVASREEKAALGGLTGLFAGCIPAGKQMSFDINSMRGTLALAYFRLAMAARGVLWAGPPTLPIVRAREAGQ